TFRRRSRRFLSDPRTYTPWRTRPPLALPTGQCDSPGSLPVRSRQPGRRNPSECLVIPHRHGPAVRYPALEIIPVTLSVTESYREGKPAEIADRPSVWPGISALAHPQERRTTHLCRYSRTAFPWENGIPTSSCRVFSATASPIRSAPCPS